MNLPEYRSPEVKSFVDDVTGAIVRQRAEVASILLDVPGDIHAVAEEIEALTGGWNAVELYTAANFETERDAFLDAVKRGEDYVPRFRYDRAESFDVDAGRAALLDLRERLRASDKGSDRDRLARITLLAKIDDDLATCDIAEGLRHGDDALAKRGFEKKYPGGDPSLTAFATEAFASLLSEEPADGPSLLDDDEKEYLRGRIMTPEEQAHAFAWALKRLGLFRERGAEGDGFQVILDPNATALDVRDKSALGPTVVVPTSRDGTMTAAELCALIEHEIGGHARQAANGKKLFRVGGGALRKDDETLYEGLAMRYEWRFMEKWFGTATHDMDLSTLYVFAVDIAEKGGSFRQVFDDQLERRIRLKTKVPLGRPAPAEADLDPADYEECLKKAWRTAYRVMRGHSDATNREGFAMAKDLAYLRGWLMDRQLLEAGLGHANEAAIVSADGLRTLSTIDLTPEDLPVKYAPIGEEYMRMLLAQRPSA